MTTVQNEKIARRKLSLLQLPQELGNVSKACKIVATADSSSTRSGGTSSSTEPRGSSISFQGRRARTRTESAMMSRRQS